MIHSFLLIGQSNMAGRGYLAEAHEIDTTHIKTLRNSSDKSRSLLFRCQSCGKFCGSLCEEIWGGRRFDLLR